MRITVEVPDADVWSAVFGSAFDTYPWWRDVRFHHGTDWQTPGLVRLVIDNPYEPEGSTHTRNRTIGMPQLEEAINTGISAGLVPNDVEKWDSADYADTILQIAVLGDVYYG